MAAVDRTTRLQRELVMIRRKPNEGIWVAPQHDDLGLWHVVLAGAKGSDYEGGYYHGTIEFPDKYPYKAPSVRMLTPSGRFVVGRSICMSMTAWHPESWNPAWNIGTLTVGFSSFMHDDNDGGVESMKDTPASRRKMAADSMAFNMRDAHFVDLFPEVIAAWYAGKDAAAAPTAGAGASASAGSVAVASAIVVAPAVTPAPAPAAATPAPAPAVTPVPAPAVTPVPAPTADTEPRGEVTGKGKGKGKRATDEPIRATAASGGSEGRYPKRARGSKP